MNNIGPQTSFPVPEGILHYNGENYVALILWSMETSGVKLQNFELVADTIIQSGYSKPSFVEGAPYRPATSLLDHYEMTSCASQMVPWSADPTALSRSDICWRKLGLAYSSIKKSTCFTDICRGPRSMRLQFLWGTCFSMLSTYGPGALCKWWQK